MDYYDTKFVKLLTQNLILVWEMRFFLFNG